MCIDLYGVSFRYTDARLFVRCLALAQNELDDVFETFEYQQEGVGYLFVEAFKKTLEYIKAYPDTLGL